MTEKTAPAGQKTILLVDDEPSILSSLRRLFRPHGYRILTAGGGAAGLEIMATEQVDMVISDIRMPEMEGTVFLEKVHAGWPGVVRMFLTGYADMHSTLDALGKSEIFCYISKPWNDEEILQTVRAGFERQQLQNAGKRKTVAQAGPAREKIRQWLSLAMAPLSLVLTWIGANLLGWPRMPAGGEGPGALLLAIFAIWSGLQILCFALSWAWRTLRRGDG